MAYYKENAVTGTQWTRARRVVLDNPLEGTQNITFEEEEVVQVGDTFLKQPISSSYNNGVVGNLTNPATTFELLNPVTGARVGTMSYEAFYTTMYSMYLHLAKERDARVEASNTPTPDVSPTPPPAPEPAA